MARSALNLGIVASACGAQRITQPHLVSAGERLCMLCRQYPKRENVFAARCAHCSSLLSRLRKQLTVFGHHEMRQLLQSHPDPQVFRKWLDHDKGAAVRAAEDALVCGVRVEESRAQEGGARSEEVAGGSIEAPDLSIQPAGCAHPLSKHSTPPAEVESASPGASQCKLYVVMPQ